MMKNVLLMMLPVTLLLAACSSKDDKDTNPQPVVSFRATQWYSLEDNDTDTTWIVFKAGEDRMSVLEWDADIHPGNNCYTYSVNNGLYTISGNTITVQEGSSSSTANFSLSADGLVLTVVNPSRPSEAQVYYKNQATWADRVICP